MTQTTTFWETRTVWQQLIIFVLCIVVVLGSLGAAGWAAIQVLKQGIDALFLLIVCLTLAAAFAFVPFQAWRDGTLKKMLGKTPKDAGEK